MLLLLCYFVFSIEEKRLAQKAIAKEKAAAGTSKITGFFQKSNKTNHDVDVAEDDVDENNDNYVKSNDVVVTEE